jgi:polyhydroxyalkanoate synthase subunit PhaC
MQEHVAAEFLKIQNMFTQLGNNANFGAFGDPKSMQSAWSDAMSALPDMNAMREEIPKNAAEMMAAWMKAMPPSVMQTNPSMEAWQHSLQEAAGKVAQQWQQYQDRLGIHTKHPSAEDKRFATEAWQTLPNYQMLADAYVFTSKAMMLSLENMSLDEEEKKRARFFLKQYLDAVAPSNFFATNPEAIKLAIETNGDSLKHGVDNLQADIGKGHVSITDETAFEVGGNIAVSPGQVVFENDIIQLIQYAPSTPQVYLRPLLIVPPCINKFYILDLTPENSYIAYAVAQGHTVFVISWRNVDASLGALTWDDYVANGVVKAIDVIRCITNVHKINALGFCVGGTLLACALAILKRMGHDIVESITFLTTFIDFSDVGEINAYIDENFIETKEREIGAQVGGGLVSGADLAFAFSTLRANDLIWNYVINNYLKGGKPAPFDLLYWNADSTNLPGPWYCWYVRNAYMNNLLVKPDALTVCGVPLDVSVIDAPTFVYGSKDDHIVPWRSAYASGAALGGKVMFTLGASGHIAGVVNPASKNRRNYWIGGGLDQSADQWLGTATEKPGSWWPRWSEWLSQYGGKKIAARRELGSDAFPPIEAAPGRYVKEKA